MLRNQVWGQYISGVEGLQETSDGFGNALVSGDFGGDGYDDLAIGVLFEDIGSIRDAGAVNVLYGSLSGLTATLDQVWSQDDFNTFDKAESADRFGTSLAAADFNGDGRDDLVIGAPFESLGVRNSISGAGAVNVLYSSTRGLSSLRNQTFKQTLLNGTLNDYEVNDFFGSSLATGDFDGDNFADLAIGAYGENAGSIVNSGAVNVLYGTRNGLSESRSEYFEQGKRGVNGELEAGDLFGYSLTVGDFDGDGYDDLAVGSVAEDVGSKRAAGAVNVIYGSLAGLTAVDDSAWTQDSFGIAGAAEDGDQFGASLGAGDFNGDGRDDLAIGVSLEDIGSKLNAGAVNVLYGTSRGVAAPNDRIFHRDVGGINGVATTFDQFGTSLGVGDFNGDGFEDLAIGAPGSDFGTVRGAGSVQVIYGSSRGLTAVGDQLWYEDDLGGRLNNSEAGDRFGASLGVGDHNGDGIDDLSIGVPGEDIATSSGGTLSNVGKINVLYGSTGGGLTV